MTQQTKRIVALMEATSYAIKLASEGYTFFLEEIVGRVACWWEVTVYREYAGSGELVRLSDKCQSFEY